MQFLRFAAVGSFVLAALAPAAAQSPAPAVADTAVRRPVLLNGCSLTSASTAGGASSTQLTTGGSVQHVFTAMYTVITDKPVSSVQVQGTAAGQTEVWTDNNPFPKSGPVTHSVNFPGDIIVDEVSCKIKSVKFSDGSSYTPPAAKT